MHNKSEEIFEQESKILFRLKRGDTLAFDILYNEYSPKLYRNILRMVKQEILAEEILQDVFIKLWEKKETLNIETSLKSYLFRIAHNLIMDIFRRAAFDKHLLQHLISISTQHACNTNEIIDLKDTQILLQEAIDSLSTQRRKIYLLVKFEGKSYKEVSELLNISQSTISDHIVKATKTVKEKLTDKDYAIIMAAIAITMHNYNNWN